jgi:hypothetical protein
VIADMLFGKMQTGKNGSSATVDKFVVAKASRLNKVQQNSTKGPQTIQHQSLITNKNL